MASGFEGLVLSYNPIAWWRLGESSGTTAVDASGNGHDGTYEGSPTLGVDGLVGDDSFYFRAVGDDAHMSIHTVEGAQETLSIGNQFENGGEYTAIVQYDGTHMRIFIDGVEVANKELNETLSPWGVGHIGRWRDSDPRSFDGLIDEPFVCDYALSDDQIAALHNATQYALLLGPPVERRMT